MRPYYEQDGITIYHADCREILPLSADHVVTDPPYGLDFPYPSYDDARDGLPGLIATSFPLILRSSPSAMILCGPTQIAFYPEPNWVACVTWNTTGTFGRRGYSQWTPILCYGDDLDGFGNVNGVTKSDTLRISGGGGVGFRRNNAERSHCCPKPETIMRAVIARFTRPDSVVLDPFMGSGTTLVAAKNLGRKAIGIEIEERYCEIAVKRLAQRTLGLF